LIPGPTLALYAHDVAAAGFAENLVQQYVRRDGHCTFTTDEVGRTFDELIHWVNTGQRPVPGLLPGSNPANGQAQANHTNHPIGAPSAGGPVVR
jgi:hypothetical protein